MKRTTLFFLFIFIILLHLAAQSSMPGYNSVYNPVSSTVNGTSKDFLPVSPTAGSLGIYGQIPVGNYTGTAIISIPLYEVRYKELSVPIGISYHASGIKPDILPGSVGIGWSMQSGGCISRVIRGIPDYESSSYDGSLEFEDVPQCRTRPDWHTSETLNHYLVNGVTVTDNTNDPDEFYFNFNGNVGKFFLDHTNNFRIQSQQGLSFLTKMEKVVDHEFTFPLLKQNRVPSPPFIEYSNKVFKKKTLYKFTMVDANGIKYTFGGNDDSIEFSRPGLRYGQFPSADASEIVPMTWYLTSVESPNGYRIDFNYGRQNVVTKARFTDVAMFQIKGKDAEMGNARVSVNYDSNDCEKSTLMNGCYLKSITFPTGKVDFQTSVAHKQLDYTHRKNTFSSYSKDYNFFEKYQDIVGANTEYTGGGEGQIKFTSPDELFCTRKVDSIYVRDSQGAIINKIRFNYNNEYYRRLALLSLDIDNNRNEKMQSYEFKYVWGALPYYLYWETDDYGYYNWGRHLFDWNEFNTMGGAIDFIKNNPNHFEDVKKPNLGYASRCSLEKITYPTGGHTTFEYELHDYSSAYHTWPFRVEKNPDGNREVGGIRIKKMSNYNYDGTLLGYKKYHYVKNYLGGKTESSGVLAYKPTYVEKYADKYVMEKGSSAYYYLKEFFRVSTNPVFPLTATRGNHVTYSEVTVEEPNGFTVCKYKNYDNGYVDKELINYTGDVLSNYENGTGERVEFTKQAEGISMDLERGQQLSEEIFDARKRLKKLTTFSYNDNESRFDDNVRYLRFEPTCLHTAFGVHSYRVLAGLIYTYFPYLREKVETEYFDLPVTRKTSYEYDAGYRLLKKTTIINSDLVAQNKTYTYPHQKASGNNIYSQMVEKRLLAFPIEEITTCANRTSTVTREYCAGLSKDNPGLILLKKGLVKTEKTEARTEVEYLRYDSIGNPAEVNYLAEGTICFIWSYNKEYPIAKIEGTTYSQVESVLTNAFLKKLEASKYPADADIQAVRTKLSGLDVLVTTYTYSPFGVSTITQPNGTRLFFTYDALGRVLSIKDNQGNAVEEYKYHYRKK